MNRESGLHLRWTVVVLMAVGFVCIGAAGAYLWMRSRVPAMTTAAVGAPPAPEKPATLPATSADPASPLPDVAITLTSEAVQRAGIETTPVGTSGEAGRLRLPGVVQPNAYRSVTVTALAGGRVTRVSAELGQSVRRGQVLAEVYSPELAEAQTRYISTRAELDAHERELRRVEKLVEIGAASRQELEKIHAEHTAATTAVESARSRLTLLGVSDAHLARLTSASDVAATRRVTAPIDGVVTARQANAGLNVEAASALFTVVDLSTVWIVADVYEKDFAHVRVGNAARVTTTAYPDLILDGKISYIDPEVKPETRTAQVRVEVPNRDSRLRLGMYAEIHVEGAGPTSELTVPRAAVQMVGDRSVVYLADPKAPSRFLEREVRLGEVMGDQIAVRSGVQRGDVVVAKGSFSIRAERERLGLRSPTSGAMSAAEHPAERPSSNATQPTTSGIQTVRVTLSDKGYQPDRVTLRAGVPATITFIRTSDKTCGTEIVVPSLKIKKPLPLNQPVDVEFTPQKAGAVGFECGMGMLKGTIVVQ